MTAHGNATSYVYGCRCTPCTEANRVRTRTNRLLRNGWTDAEYDRTLVAQDGRCAICRQAETRLNVRGEGIAPLSADHDHATGLRRGLLCGRCNLLLGNVNDDIGLLGSMIAYLTSFIQRNVGTDDRAPAPPAQRREHVLSADCWCKPEVEQVVGDEPEPTCCDYACYEDPGCACEGCVDPLAGMSCDHGVLFTNRCYVCEEDAQ